MRKKIKRILATMLIVGGILSINVSAWGNFQHGYWKNSWCGYQAGYAWTQNTSDEGEYHYTKASIGYDSSIDYGYRYTQTDTVSGYGFFLHSYCLD